MEHTGLLEKTELKSFNRPEEVREFPLGRLELVNVGGKSIARVILQPDWKWSSSVKPLAKTKSCEVAHLQYLISGTLHVRSDDGSEFDCRAGDVFYLSPGHDAWVVGDEPVIAVDFQGMLQYGLPR